MATSRVQFLFPLTRYRWRRVSPKGDMRLDIVSMPRLEHPFVNEKTQDAVVKKRTKGQVSFAEPSSHHIGRSLSPGLSTFKICDLHHCNTNVSSSCHCVVIEQIHPFSRKDDLCSSVKQQGAVVPRHRNRAWG